MKENSIENLQNKKYFNNIDEAIKVYEEFRRFKNDGFIESIDPDFFFNLTDNILSDYKRLQEEFKQVDHECERLEEKEVRLIKENEQLKEYIAIAPNLDEMTAIKYRNIRQDAYIQGRAEEQQKARQIINENYIPVQKIKDKIEDLKKEGSYRTIDNPSGRVHFRAEGCDYKIQVLKELLE